MGTSYDEWLREQGFGDSALIPSADDPSAPAADPPPAAPPAPIAVGTFVLHVNEALGTSAFGFVYEAGELEDGTPSAAVAWLGGSRSGPMPTDQLTPVT